MERESQEFSGGAATTERDVAVLDGSFCPSLQLQPGNLILDRYRIRERVAIGGYSVVFRGLDERLMRPVCIKVFDNRATNPSMWRLAYEHFVQEAFALSALTHPNTLRIYDFGYLDGENESIPVQISEFMMGGNLTQRVSREGPIPPEETLCLVLTLCEALKEAHDTGILHRDIKPQNILFTEAAAARQPKLADFGIAKARGDAGPRVENAAEETEIVVGRPVAMCSPRWAAPEQLLGEPATARSDLYSIGAVAAYMLSGKALFSGRDVLEGVERRRHSESILQRSLNDLVSPALISVLQTVCCFEPHDRYSTVDELVRALKAARGVARLRVARASTPTTQETTALRAAPAALTRIGKSDSGTELAGRRCQFMLFADRAAVVTIRGQRLRLSVTEATDKNSVSVKGLSCFVSFPRGRASAALTVEGTATIELLSPKREHLARVTVSTGTTSKLERAFPLGSTAIALDLNDCPGAVMVDGGEGSDCFFVHR